MITTLLYSLFALDQTLADLAAQHSLLLFAALFIVIFAETGLVIFPLLPGDSLLFVSGAVAATSGISVHLFVLVLFAAAVLGDTVNYSVGHFIGPKAFHRPQDTWLGRWLKPQYLERTHRFYEKYGGFTIIIGRFVPIVRTFAPFLAGIRHDYISSSCTVIGAPLQASPTAPVTCSATSRG
jgi:membrane-associated protein